MNQNLMTLRTPINELSGLASRSDVPTAMLTIDAFRLWWNTQISEFTPTSSNVNIISTPLVKSSTFEEAMESLSESLLGTKCTSQSEGVIGIPGHTGPVGYTGPVDRDIKIAPLIVDSNESISNAVSSDVEDINYVAPPSRKSGWRDGVYYSQYI